MPRRIIRGPQPFALRSPLGFTTIQVVIAVVVVSVLAFLVISVITATRLRHRIVLQLQQGQHIYSSIRHFAEDHGGRYPGERVHEGKKSTAEDSNEALAALLPRYLDTIAVFRNKESAWTYPFQKWSAAANVIHHGGNDWCYVRGLSTTTAPDWPLLANAFVPGTTVYCENPAEPGGVWHGKRAVVVWANGASAIVDTTRRGETFFVPRKDRPELNAFDQTPDWLSGPDVKLLYPESRSAALQRMQSE